MSYEPTIGPDDHFRPAEILSADDRNARRLAAAEQMAQALKDLHLVVTDQNRRGATWHPEVFGRLMTALNDSANARDEWEGLK